MSITSNEHSAIAHAVEQRRNAISPSRDILSRANRSHPFRRMGRIRPYVAATVFAFLCASLEAELIPSSRLVDWTPGVTVGVPGGIPGNRSNQIDVTGAPYSADKTGATDASRAIQAAINAAKPGDVVYVPAGTYRMDDAIRLNHVRSGITVRGAGAATVMKLYGAAGFVAVGTPPGWGWPVNGNRVTAGLHKGSTQITLPETSEFIVGNNVLLGIASDPNLPVVSVAGYDIKPKFEPMRRQLTRVVAKNATTLTIFPGLYADYSATTVEARIAPYQTSFIGIEDFVVEASASSQSMPVRMENCYASWFRNIHVKGARSYSIYVSNSLQCEVRHCYMDELQNGSAASNGAGLLVETTAGCLYEDNIIRKAFPLIEVNHGSAGNVFAYNFLHDSLIGIDTNHGPHNNFNLYEGNVSPHVLADGFFGSVSDDTLFRNWFTGLNPSGPTYTTSLKRFTRNYSIVGNVLGTPGIAGGGYDFGGPNMGNGSWSGTAQPSTGDDWDDRKRIGPISIRSSDSTATVSLPNGANGLSVGQWPITARWEGGVRGWLEVISVSASAVVLGDGGNASVGDPLPPQGTTLQLWVGAHGFQERDLDVDATTIRKGNFLSAKDTAGSIPASESLGSEKLPSSLFRTNKPNFFGDLTWPPVDPDNAAGIKYEVIPAGYRFVHGVEAPGIGGNPVPEPQPEPKRQSPISVRTASGKQ